jgi:toxin HigB-1
MDVCYSTRKVEKVFNSRSELRRKYGSRMAREIEDKITFLEAAPNLWAVPATPPYRRHALDADMKGKFAVDLIQPFRLIFKPNHNPLPRGVDGALDLRRVTAITILDAKDYH